MSQTAIRRNWYLSQNYLPGHPALPTIAGRASSSNRRTVEVDELYVAARLKGRGRYGRSRSRGLSTYGKGSYDQDKSPVFLLAERGSGDRYVLPAKAVDESTIRFFLAERREESTTVYTDGFRAYDPLEKDDAFDCEYVVHGEENTLMETFTSTPARARLLARSWLSPHRSLQGQTHAGSQSGPNPTLCLSKTGKKH